MEFEKLQQEDLEDEDIRIEIEESAFKRPGFCTTCNKKMRPVITDFQLPGRELTLHLAAYKCPTCGKEVLNEQQAEKFQEMLLLLDAMKDKSKVKFERSVNHDGKSFFIRFPKELTGKWNKKMVTEIMPITSNEMIIHVHKV